MPVARMILASLLFTAACSAAYADQPVAGPALPAAHIALGIAPARIRAPYDVQILRENGESLPTYNLRDRFYVQGNVGERYTIRIVNPTPRRVEAVVTVDGLDVIDGENGDLRKRGYVVPAYGETRIEGFRTSTSDVATFRFSSVTGSYAGQKGKARNVGVIAVALFEEHMTETDQIIVGQAPPPPVRPRPYRYRRYDVDGRAEATADGSAPRKRGFGAAKDDEARSAGRDAKAAEAPAAPAARPAPAPQADRYVPPSADYDDGAGAPMHEPERQPRERLGLGTEFGEQRYSAASYTRFVRGPSRPVAIAELRYNDTAGLMALGVPVQPLPGTDEIMMRETADPFPGDRFARPPR
jgi:hypothetical protein